MADNVLLPATGTGTASVTQATDDVVGVHYPVVKLADGTLDSTTVIAAGGGVEANALRVTVANDSTGLISVDDNGGSLTVDNAGTFATQATATGNVAHAATDSGNPVKVGAKASSSLAGATLVTAGQRTDLMAGLDGALLVRPYGSNADIKSNRVADTGGTSTAFSAFTAVAGTRNYLTTLTIFNSSATAGFVDIRDGTAGAVIFTAPAPAGGGSVISFPVPLRQPTANTALAYDVSAALTTVYISAVGFQSKT